MFANLTRENGLFHRLKLPEKRVFLPLFTQDFTAPNVQHSDSQAGGWFAKNRFFSASDSFEQKEPLLQRQDFGNIATNLDLFCGFFIHIRVAAVKP